MEFHEKLDFLMNLTGTSNVLISQQTKLDPSYISRLRNGKRNPIRDASVIREMAGHFARQCTNSYQHERMEAAVGAGYIDDAYEGRVGRIESWLFQDDAPTGLKQSPAHTRLRRADGIYRARHVHIERAGSRNVYHGVEGKLQATERLLNEVLRSPTPLCLLLLTDQNMNWKWTDSSDQHRLNNAISKVIEAGHTIKAIHRVDRNLSDMLSAINQWMPFYSTGRVKSYYYPLLRDDLYQRTLLIAPGIAAVSSGSVNESVEQAVSFFVTGENDVRAFEAEFDQVLALCKPLVYAPPHSDREKYLEFIHAFDLVSANTVIRTQSLCLLTMPDAVVKRVTARSREASSWLPAFHRNRKALFFKQLETNTIHEIIPRLAKRTINKEKIPLNTTNIMHSQPLYYKTDEYLEHLEHCIELVQQQERFHVTLSAKAPGIPYSLYVKEGYGALMTNQTMPPVTLVAFETKITASLYEHLEFLAGVRHFAVVDDELQIRKLLHYIDAIRQEN
jgi:hypothetical protein